MGDETTIFTTQWGDQIMHLAQQSDSLLEGTVTLKTGVVGERTTMEQLGKKDLKKRTGRHQPMEASDPDFRRRWITMFDYDDSTLFDKQDELKTLLNPKNAFNQSLIMGYNRVKDIEILAALLGTAYYGKAGTSTQTITNSIANGGTGLTKAKLTEALETFRSKYVYDDEEKYLVIGPKDHTDLLNLVEATSKDYTIEAVLVNGVVKKFMGFNIITSQLLFDNHTASSITSCVAYTRMGIGLALAAMPQLDVSQRKDIKGIPWQAYCAISCGASRLEEDRVIQIDTYHA